MQQRRKRGDEIKHSSGNRDVSRTREGSRREGSKEREPTLNSAGRVFQSIGTWRKTYALVPLVLALLTSANALKNQFVYDDLTQVLNNDFIKQISNIPLAFTNSVWAFLTDSLWSGDSYFRPLFTTLFTINYAVFGTQPFGWHLVSIVIHAVVALFVFFVFQELTDSNWLALATAVLFAVHPVHSESVAWVSGVPDPLMAMFLLPAFYLYLRYRKTGSKYLIALAVVAYFLAVLSKETSVMLPPLIVFCEIVHFGSSAKLGRRIVRAGVLGSLFVLPIALYAVMRYYGMGYLLRGSSGLRPAWMTIPLVFAKYLWLILVPFGYNLQHYTEPVTSLTAFAFWGPCILIALIAAAVVLSKSRELRFAAVWFCLWLAPPLGALRVLDPLYYVQERYLYLPSIGFCLAVALGFRWLASKRIGVLTGQTAAVAIFFVLASIWGVLMFHQNTAWHDPLSLSMRAVEANPRSAYARSGLAATYFGLGNLRAAEEEARKGVELDALCMDAHLNLSYIHASQGNVDQAIKDLEQAKTLARDGAPNALARIHRTLGSFYQKVNDPRRAEENLRASVDVIPYPYPPNSILLADFYFDQGRYESARDVLESVLPYVPPKYSLIHLKLGRVFDRLHQRDRARAEFEKYLSMVPATAKDRGEAMRYLSSF
jgi:protein O-mannosyl-transferase